MRICNLNKCSRKHYAKNYCFYHWLKFRWKNAEAYRHGLSIGTIYYAGVCKTEDCKRGVYAKEYCRKHYANIRYREKHKILCCQAPNCGIKTKNKTYCSLHTDKYLLLEKRNLPIDFSVDLRKGKYSYKWNGGISDYPDHWLMKKNRRIKIQQTKGQCEKCKGKGKHIHHKDGSKNNHSLDNLIFLCCKCHGKLHAGRKIKNSKFIRLYGLTLIEICRRYNITRHYISLLTTTNNLKSFLRQKNLSPH